MPVYPFLHSHNPFERHLPLPLQLLGHEPGKKDMSKWKLQPEGKSKIQKLKYKVRTDSLRLLQSWPWNPRKHWHLPPTQSPLKLHKLGHCPDTTTGSELQSSWYAGQINSPTFKQRASCQSIKWLTKMYKEIDKQKIVILTIKAKELNGSTSSRTCSPDTINCNLQWNKVAHQNILFQQEKTMDCEGIRNNCNF